MADPIVNFFKSTLVGTYSDTDTSITIATGDGALLPDPSTDGAFNLTIFEGLQVTGSTEFEIVRVTARSGDVLTVTRGAESTTPLTIGSATYSILMSATKKTFDDINTAIANVNVTNLTGVEELTFDSTGDEEFGLPAGTTAQRPASPSQGYMRYNTDDGIGVEVYNGNRWVSLGAGLAQLALDVAQLSVTANNLGAENIVEFEVDYLVIAGGGGGGSGDPAVNEGGGGGGAGGYRTSGGTSGGNSAEESSLLIRPQQPYNIIIGAGGSGGPTGVNPGVQGSDSSALGITSIGGGYGAGGDGGNGGSGGGAGSSPFIGGSGTIGQGTGGGRNYIYRGGGGGGGGAGQSGEEAPGGYVGGNGGNGLSNTLRTGVAETRAGGGGGGASFNFDDGGDGGSGGGGNGSKAIDIPPTAGVQNTGGGGGGGGSRGSSEATTVGANGGSGIVILSYPSQYTITIGAGLTGTESTVGANKVATITAGTGNVSWS